MASETVVRARIDAATKRAAAETLAGMGLTVSDYIRLALVRVAREKAVPFDVRVPNDVTAETLRRSGRGEDVHEASDVKDLFGKLGL